MKLLGWDIVPESSEIEFKFEEGPIWLRLMALTPILEKFAYPIAVRQHLGHLWSASFTSDNQKELETFGWIVHSREKNAAERFSEGSLALMSNVSPNFSGHRPKFYLTRWGRVRATRKWVHKSNGTYIHFKNKTVPSELL